MEIEKKKKKKKKKASEAILTEINSTCLYQKKDPKGKFGAVVFPPEIPSRG